MIRNFNNSTKHTIMRMHIKSLLIVGLLTAHSASAQVFVSQPQTALDARSKITLKGSFGKHHVRLPDSTIGVRLDVDHTPDRNEMTIQSWVTVDDAMSLSSNFKNENGQLVPISGMIEFDATFEFLDSEAMWIWDRNQAPKVPWISDGSFTQYSIPSTDNNVVSGSYSFSGPTENVEGTFSISPPWRRGTDGAILLMDEFPSSMVLDRNSLVWWSVGSDETMIEESVDGVDLSIGLDGVNFFTPLPFSLNAEISAGGFASSVPEPSTYALSAGIMLIAFVAFRRFKAKVATT